MLQQLSHLKRNMQWTRFVLGGRDVLGRQYLALVVYCERPLCKPATWYVTHRQFAPRRGISCVWWMRRLKLGTLMRCDVTLTHLNHHRSLSPLLADMKRNFHRTEVVLARPSNILLAVRPFSQTIQTWLNEFCGLLYRATQPILLNCVIGQEYLNNFENNKSRAKL